MHPPALAARLWAPIPAWAACILIASATAGCDPSAQATTEPLDASVTLDAMSTTDADGQQTGAELDAVDSGEVPSADGGRLDHADVADVAEDVHPLQDLPPGPWRSHLYPDDWKPGDGPTQELRLHDFSYAGYRNGESAPAAPTDAPTFDVTAFGADPLGLADATAGIQQAIDAAAQAGGGVVYVPPGLFRVDGNLQVTASRTVLQGAGSALSRLHFTATAALPQKHHVVFRGDPVDGPDLPMVADAAAFDGVVHVADASGLKAGDDLVVGWVITPEFVAEHHMKAHWKVFNDTWQPFFRRTVVSVDTSQSPHRVVLDVPLRYATLVANGASIRKRTGLLQEVGVVGIGLANAATWDAAWGTDQLHAVAMNSVKDGWIDDVASFPSPSAPLSGKGAGAHLQSGGILITASKRVTVANSVMQLPQNRGPGGNGYLFEVRASSEILFRDCVGRAGRHNFIQNWGFGTTGVVWLRVHSTEGKAEASATSAIGPVGHSEFHHSLAMANLIDSCVVDDGWSAVNRKDWSSGAGATATQTVFWNTMGAGKLRSYQHGWGFVVGTGPDLELGVVAETAPEGIEQAAWDALAAWEWASPNDWLEGEGRAADLVPASLYEDQLSRRLAP